MKEHEVDNIVKLPNNVNVLKTAVVYGSNASGKSNFVTAFLFFKKFVFNSFRDALLSEEEEDKTSIPVNRFFLNSYSVEDSSEFEITFKKGSYIYRYGFEVNEEIVISEWLFRTSKRETLLFERNKQNFEFNKSVYREHESLKFQIPDNVLALSATSHLNNKESRKVVDWLSNLNGISGIQDKVYKKFTVSLFQKNEYFRKWAKQFVDFLEISNITAEDVELKFERSKDGSVSAITAELETSSISKKKKTPELFSWHRQYDENGLFVDTIPFIFEHMESEGTKKLVYLLGPWFDTLINGKVLIVDELDSRLHPLLTRKLIEFFHQTNKKNAQLVFASHDTNLLHNSCFRRDQIWFVEKNQFGVSKLYSLADFKSSQVRPDSSYERNYIKGKYGGIPLFSENFIDELNSLWDAKA